ncbi:MAG: homoserine kinase [Janthinobacterium lividum]
MLHLRLPATSANLGPGFDAAGLAMELWLEISAEPAKQDALLATGRNADLVGSLRKNLILQTYHALAPEGPPLRLILKNDIPLGMGCGSSAAALLAGVVLANEFGGLAWTPLQVLEEACRREGHPDNVAACFHGGFTVSLIAPNGTVEAASFAADSGWRLLLAMPTESLSTSVARALLPDQYSRQDAVRNVQGTALLVAAFAQGRGELLQSATEDFLHQPYRRQVCPLLPRLLPLSGVDGVYSVTLSGAGPSVLLICGAEVNMADVRTRVEELAKDLAPELVEIRIASGMQVSRIGSPQVTEDTPE